MNYHDTIVIARDFSEAPGARYRADGPKSGEEFLEELLKPKFEQAMQASAVLLVDLDGTWGYASSFVSGAFGGLARQFTPEIVHKHLVLKSDEDPLLIKTITQDIDAEKQSAK